MSDGDLNLDWVDPEWERAVWEFFTRRRRRRPPPLVGLAVRAYVEQPPAVFGPRDHEYELWVEAFPGAWRLP